MTNSSGYAEISGASGNWTIFVEADGYERYAGSSEITYNDKHRIYLTPTPTSHHDDSGKSACKYSIDGYPPLTIEIPRYNTDYCELYGKHKELITSMTINTSKLQYDVNVFKKIWEKNQSRYETVAESTDLPAILIAALHFRESSGDFTTYLHQGDPLGAPALHYPTNIPVFYKWEDSAIDALTREGRDKTRDDLGLRKNSTDLAAMATFAELYNGLGYHNKNTISPYVYSATDRYTSGKYVADGVYDPMAVDKQVGILALMDSIYNDAETNLRGSINRLL